MMADTERGSSRNIGELDQAKKGNLGDLLRIFDLKTNRRERNKIPICALCEPTTMAESSFDICSKSQSVMRLSPRQSRESIGISLSGSWESSLPEILINVTVYTEKKYAGQSVPLRSCSLEGTMKSRDMLKVLSHFFSCLDRKHSLNARSLRQTARRIRLRNQKTENIEN